MAMEWHDLLFMHWPVDPSALAASLPRGLELDRFEGEAWLGVVPFRMAGVRPRIAPALPGLSAFPELNVRTYVKAEDVPGVWFYSLDAASRVAVRVARFSFHLPYFDARMSCRPKGGDVVYASERRHRGAPEARFVARYRGLGTPPGDPPELVRWLTERYCLYAARSDGRLLRGEIHHAPWPLECAEADVEALDMTRLVNVCLPGREPLLHFARRLDVVAWLPEKLE